MSDRHFLPTGYVPSENDILCGRARENYHHVGNLLFREFIESNLGMYLRATTKTEKSEAIAELVDRIQRRCPSGGFIKKDGASGNWYKISDDEARDKVGHAVRKAIQKLQDTQPDELVRQREAQYAKASGSMIRRHAEKRKRKVEAFKTSKEDVDDRKQPAKIGNMSAAREPNFDDSDLQVRASSPFPAAEWVNACQFQHPNETHESLIASLEPAGAGVMPRDLRHRGTSASALMPQRLHQQQVDLQLQIRQKVQQELKLRQHMQQLIQNPLAESNNYLGLLDDNLEALDQRGQVSSVTSAWETIQRQANIDRATATQQNTPGTKNARGAGFEHMDGARAGSATTGSHNLPTYLGGLLVTQANFQAQTFGFFTEENFDNANVQQPAFDTGTLRGGQNALNLPQQNQVQQIMMHNFTTEMPFEQQIGTDQDESKSNGGSGGTN